MFPRLTLSDDIIDSKFIDSSCDWNSRVDEDDRSENLIVKVSSYTEGIVHEVVRVNEMGKDEHRRLISSSNRPFSAGGPAERSAGGPADVIVGNGGIYGNVCDRDPNEFVCPTISAGRPRL